MEIWRGYTVGHGRFVRRVFGVASWLPWPLAVVALSAKEWGLAVFLVLFGLLAYGQYRRMRHFTTTMERWVTRCQSPAGGNRSGVPRQFSIRTLLVITALYALLFGLLRSMKAPPWISVGLALLFTVVGLAQRHLYQGQRPQRASMMAGALFFLAIYVVGFAATGNPHPPFGPFDPVEAAMLGATWGYVCGLILSGVFFLLRMATGTDAVEEAKERLETSSGQDAPHTE